MKQYSSRTALQVAPFSFLSTLSFWKILQLLFWFVGVALLWFLFFEPAVGTMLFWNILIPIAPALLVIGTGVWRNVCPLGTTALLPDRFGFSKKLKLSGSDQMVFNLTGVILLLVIIPLRHVVFDRNGQATATIIIALSITALITGFIYERKSGWCSGLCPVHPVEKLYGSGAGFTLPNSHCRECVKCSVPCPDSTQNVRPFFSRRSKIDKVNELLLVGGFPGYVWGWFQVPDYIGSEGWHHLTTVYGCPMIGAVATMSLYIFIRSFFHAKNKIKVVSLFAASAVSCYYWYRLPLLIGFGKLNTNSTLIDLTNVLPQWTVVILNVASTGFFLWWIVIRRKNKISWTIRPEYLDKKS